MIRPLAFAAAALLLMPGARAMELPRVPVLNLAAAQGVLEAAAAEAHRQGWAGSLAVTDAGGALLAMERMDGAGPASATIAAGKARTAAQFRRPTAAFEDAINTQRAAAITSGYVMMAGGVPLVMDGQVVGAIGVSAETPQHDMAIAQAGAAALGR